MNRTLCVIAHDPLAPDGEDSTGNFSAIPMKNTKFGGLYSSGVYGETEAYTFSSDGKKDWDMARCSIGTRFLVSETGKADADDDAPFGRPVFYTDHRWLGHDLEKDGTVSVANNNSETVKSKMPMTLNK